MKYGTIKPTSQPLKRTGWKTSRYRKNDYRDMGECAPVYVMPAYINEAWSYTLTATSADGGAVTFYLVSQDGGTTTRIVDGNLQLTWETAGTKPLIIRAVDSNDAWVEQRFAIQVLEPVVIINEPPVIRSVPTEQTRLGNTSIDNDNLSPIIWTEKWVVYWIKSRFQTFQLPPMGGNWKVFSCIYTGWSDEGGQTNLPQQFSLRWSPFNGGTYDDGSCGYGYYSYNAATFSAPNFSVTMYDEPYNGEEYETNEVWHKGRSIYGSGGYSYSGTSPVSHIPNGSLPTAPSTTGNTSMPDAPVVYAGNPNFGNFAFVNVEAIIDAKYTKLAEPVMPEPVIQPETPKPPAIVSQAPRGWVGFFSDTGKSVVSGMGTIVSVVTAPVTEVVHNVSTVYGNMRSSGNGRVKSAVVAVAAQAARSTGVENLSYAWDDTDPVTGEQYSGGWRAAYAAFGAGELVVSAFGTKAAGEAAIGSVKGLFTSKPSATPNGCFLPGTLVSRYTLDNTEQKELIPIEQINQCDKVWSCDSLSGRWQPKEVLDVLTHIYTGDIITVQYEGGQIEITGGHPIWVKTGYNLENRPRCEHIYADEHEMQPHGRWVNARDLKIGDELISHSASSLHITGISARTEVTTVHNLTVADYHTYAVGNAEALVHNKAQWKKSYRDTESSDYSPRRKSENDRMKPGHIDDKKTMDALEREYNWTKEKRREFHQYIQEMKRSGETLTWQELNDLARDF